MSIDENPWKGLDSYSDSDNSIYFGRKNETITFVDTIFNNRFAILYGPSGVGKSSLLNAGVKPVLSEKNFFVTMVSMRQLDLNSDISVASQILSKIKEQAIACEVDITPLHKEDPPQNTKAPTKNQNHFEDSLWYFFHTNEFWSSRNELLIPVIIIDQFEDIFKEEVIDNVPEDFFNNLDELSNVVPPISIRKKIQDTANFVYNQSSDFHFIFSLREDYLPRLDDYVYSINIPELKKARYGITLMDTDQAREVILEPKKGLVSEPVADKIITILSNLNSHNHKHHNPPHRLEDQVSNYAHSINNPGQKRIIFGFNRESVADKTNTSLTNQSSHNRKQHKIEPFLLSLYMYRVYIEMINRGLSTISEDLINKIGTDVVNDFYVESMKKVSSRAMKHLEEVLLTPKGHRDSISKDKLMESRKVSDAELNTLLAARIIKKSTVNNVERYEYTHDIISNFAQKNKEERDRNNISKIVIGYVGTFLTLAFAALVGWIMSAPITYVSIPILIITSIICAYGFMDIKLLSTKRLAIFFLILCGLLGVCLDLTQIIPSIGYILYGLVLVASFYLLKKYADKAIIESPKIKYKYVSAVWLISFIIIPFLCFGYNIFNGLNFSRCANLSSKMFYVKNGDGQWGLRNRFTIVIPPQYDDKLQLVGKEYIAKANGKFGMLDSTFQQKTTIKFDSIICSNNTLYFYLDNKEVFENGIEISWNKNITERQKNVLRKIVRNMILIKGGDFKMGTNEKIIRKKYSGYIPSDGEEYIHTVYLTDYYLSKYEATLEDWIEIMEYDPRKQGRILKSDSIDNMNIPVYKISYEDCQKYIEKIRELTGVEFSLPTEAQWEYAARGGVHHENYDFAGSNSECTVGWVGKNSDRIPHVIGEKGVKGENSLGLADMTGNVAEFCKDYMSKNFYKESDGQTNPCCNEVMNDNSIISVVIRGGAYESLRPENCLVTRRNSARADFRYTSTGFRVAINPSINQ